MCVGSLQLEETGGFLSLGSRKANIMQKDCDRKCKGQEAFEMKDCWSLHRRQRKYSAFLVVESCFYSRAFLWTPAVSYSCIPGRQFLFVLPSTVLNLSRWLSWWKVCWDCPGHSAVPGGDEVLISVCDGYSFQAKIVSFDDVLSKILSRREHTLEITKSPVQA